MMSQKSSLYDSKEVTWAQLCNFSSWKLHIVEQMLNGPPKTRNFDVDKKVPNQSGQAFIPPTQAMHF